MDGKEAFAIFVTRVEFFGFVIWGAERSVGKN
jgi:hypothetical protein